MEPVPVPPLAEVVAPTADAPAISVPTAEVTLIPAKLMRKYCNPRLPTGSDYSRDNPRRSARQHQQIHRAGMDLSINDLWKISRLVGRCHGHVENVFGHFLCLFYVELLFV